jgi:hypothetical protein
VREFEAPPTLESPNETHQEMMQPLSKLRRHPKTTTPMGLVFHYSPTSQALLQATAYTQRSSAGRLNTCRGGRADDFCRRFPACAHFAVHAADDTTIAIDGGHACGGPLLHGRLWVRCGELLGQWHQKKNERPVGAPAARGHGAMEVKPASGQRVPPEADDRPKKLKTRTATHRNRLKATITASPEH